MLSPIVFFFFVFPALWLYAEFKQRRTARISLGLASIISIAFIIAQLDRILPTYESQVHRSSLKLTGDLLAKGETDRVQQAIEAYNGQASTGSTYNAAFEMWYVLNHGPRH
jgi:hypothetical protein